MHTGQYLLEMKDICKNFPGVKALNNAQLYLRSGSIHALMGENGAGKSTLMKCLFGIYKKDSGSILLDGKECRFSNPKDALNNGVSMVHQELNQVLHRSVMENIWLGRFPKKFGIVSHKTMYNETCKIFQSLDIDIDPNTDAGKLSVSQRQMVEIAKAVSNNTKVLVLDEPTSSLTDEEVQHLFRILRQLSSNGVGIIYISHRMDEIKEIADEVTIMRDGCWIATEQTESISTDDIIRMMVNRDLSKRFPPKTNTPRDLLLKVEGLTGRVEPTCHNVSFELRRGEVLGIAGLVGSRRTELLETIFGIASRKSGKIEMNGKKIYNHNSKQAIKHGFALITEERRTTGIFPDMDIVFNSTIANIRSYLKFIKLSEKKMKSDTDYVINSINVKTPTKKTRISNLSGGNQQKVIIGRWLLTKPQILLLDEPTRGIDVGAKYEIYQLIQKLANEGKGVIVVSSEMPELMGICNRILVMSNGQMAGIVNMDNDSEANKQEMIMRLATKYV